MPKTPQEKAFDDVDKAIITRDRTKLTEADLETRHAAAKNATAKAERVLKWAAAHPELPDSFDLEEYIGAQAKAKSDVFEEYPAPEGGVTGEPDGASQLPDEPGDVVAELEPPAEPAPAPRKRKPPAQTVPPVEPEPAAGAAEDDPWGDDTEG